MAGRTVKFPLEVKNGTQARNMTDLVNNFDIEKIIGYFLDGRLKSWLEARYYEEEAIAIEKIDKDDPDLAKKLSEVFGVAYNETVIDPEEIERQNARITKLKQITSDEEIIRNVDLVAFDQEELADLYDSGKKKIYLCEGEFNIPKSKQNIDYVFIGEPKVNGLHSQTKSLSGSGVTDTDSDEDSMTHESPLTEDDITEDLANFIGENDYVITTDYVVFKTYGTHFVTNKQLNVSDKFERGLNIFGYWSRKDGSIKSFKLDGYSSYDDFFGTLQNKIILHKKWFEESDVLLYDLDSEKIDIVCTDWNGKEGSFSSSNHFICYQDVADNIRLYDIATDQYKTVETLEYETALCLVDSTLWYIEKNGNKSNLFRYNLENNPKRKDNCAEINEFSINDILFINNRLYLISDIYLGKPAKFFQFDLENNKFEDIINGSSFSSHEFQKINNSKYILIIEEKYDFPVNVIDLSKGNAFVLCKNCGYTSRDEHWFRADTVYYYAYSCYLVGNYFIFNEGEISSYPDHYYRINITNRQKIEIYKTEG